MAFDLNRNMVPEKESNSKLRLKSNCKGELSEKQCT